MIKKVQLFILSLLVFLNITNANSVTLKFDKYTLIGFEYGIQDVPHPMRGTWKSYLYNPEKDLNKSMSFTWAPAKNGKVRIDQKIIHSDGTSLNLFMEKDLEDWSDGKFNKERREEILKSKNLLHFDKEVMKGV